MYYEKISSNIYLLDTAPLGYRKQIAVYLVMGNEKMLLIDVGPRISSDTLYELLVNIMSELGRFNELLIALTHIHIDHAGGTGTLIRRLRKTSDVKVKVLVHPRGLRHLVNPEKLWRASVNVLGKAAELQGKPEPLEESLLRPLSDLETISLGDVEVKVIYTPGHAPHHVSFITYPDNVAITGDAVAIHYDGRIHPVSPPPFKLDLAINSIDRMRAMKPRKVAVSHYGVAQMHGAEFLEASKNKIIEWYRIIKQLVKEGIKSPEIILTEILKVDDDLRYIVDVRENNPIFKGSALQSVKGILEYVINEDLRQHEVR